MKRNAVLTQEDFENLLMWLSPDRETAGEIYENVREGLVRFFRFRGCSDPETLADDTINRVATKVTTFDSKKEVKTITYFYGFAANIYREHLAKRESKNLQLDESIDFKIKAETKKESAEDIKMDCLESCMQKLSPGENDMVLAYYSKEKKEKIELRNKLASMMNLSVSTLYLRVYRIKSVLKTCVERCFEEKGMVRKQQKVT